MFFERAFSYVQIIYSPRDTHGHAFYDRSQHFTTHSRLDNIIIMSTPRKHTRRNAVDFNCNIFLLLLSVFFFSPTCCVRIRATQKSNNLRGSREAVRNGKKTHYILRLLKMTIRVSVDAFSGNTWANRPSWCIIIVTVAIFGGLRPRATETDNTYIVYDLIRTLRIDIRMDVCHEMHLVERTQL